MDAINETVTYTGLRVRIVTADIVVIHGLFDSKDTTAQKDAFVDAFMDMGDRLAARQRQRRHRPGDGHRGRSRTTSPIGCHPRSSGRYYATHITYEGHTQGRGVMV